MPKIKSPRELLINIRYRGICVGGDYDKWEKKEVDEALKSLKEWILSHKLPNDYDCHTMAHNKLLTDLAKELET